MINFSMGLLPLKKAIKVHSWVNWSKDLKLSKNKSFEIQLTQFQIQKILDLTFTTDWYGRDHAGPGITLIIFGLLFDISIYDHRHWNYDEGRWYFDGEEQWDIPTAEEDEDAPLP